VGIPARWWVLGFILTARCLDLLDGTMTNIASADIARDLHTSTTQLQWVLSAYSLTFAIGLVVGARLGDIFGRRRLFVLGVLIFVLASIACALAPDVGALIAARAVKGFGSALLIPQGLGLIKSAFASAEIGKAIGFFGPVIGLTAVLGPVVSGALVDANLFGAGWRMVFLIHVPIGLLAAVGAWRTFPMSRVRPAPSLDVVGALFVAAFAGMLIYPLIEGRDAGWPLWTYLMMVGSALALVGLAGWTRRRELLGRDPLVVASVFGHRAYRGGIAMTLVMFGALIGGIFTLTVFLRFGQHESAIRAGLALTPYAVGLAAGSTLAATVLVPRIGRLTLQLGALLWAGGLLGTWAAVDAGGLNTGLGALIAPQLLVGIGIGLLLAPLISFVISPVRDREVGSATGVFNSAQQLASSAGIATIGTLFFSVLPTSGFVVAYERCLLLGAALMGVLFALTFLLPRRADAPSD
jgi:EmrB/QacA subfamily drug resistance transporter